VPFQIQSSVQGKTRVSTLLVSKGHWALSLYANLETEQVMKPHDSFQYMQIKQYVHGEFQ